MRSLRRVLIVQPYGIGDMLFLTPVLRALRLVPTVEKVDLLLGSRNDAAVKNNPHIDEIFTVDKDLFRRRGRFQNLRSVLDLGRELRNRRYDLLLDYSLRGEYAFFSRFFLNIPRRAGFAYKNRAFFHNIRLPLPEGFKERHVADHYCDLAEKAGLRVEDRFLEFYINPLDRVTVSDRMPGTAGRILVVSPGGGESWGKDAHFRRWPVPFFAKLAGRIYRDYEFDRCVLIGGAGDKDLAAELAGQLEIPCFNLCGQLSLGETAALMEKASLVIVNDSGLVHLGNSLRV
ncbi:MAG TPA: glycosyltransferase family 9 protein, partial [bacterium]|nr:glycosyltransferase family 9 protein [bacterium]